MWSRSSVGYLTLQVNTTYLFYNFVENPRYWVVDFLHLCNMAICYKRDVTQNKWPLNLLHSDLPDKQNINKNGMLILT